MSAPMSAYAGNEHVDYLKAMGHDDAGLQAVEGAVTASKIPVLSILGLLVKYGPLALSVLAAVLKVVHGGGKVDAPTVLAILAQFQNNPLVKEIIAAVLKLLGVTMPAGV